MNYIHLINRFWASSEIHSFRTTDIALYFYLLKVNNDCSWIESFKRNNRKIEADLDISFNTLKDARNRLKIAGLIDFKTRNGDANVQYTLSKFDKVSTEVATEVSTEVASRLVPSKDKDKSKDKHKEIQKDAPELNISFEDFWKHYDKAAGLKSKLEKKWRALTNDERVKAMKHIAEYKIAEPDKKFRKNPETYLNNKSFNDEIIYKNKNGIQQQQQPTTRIYTAQEIAQREKLLAAGRKSIAP